MPHRIWRHVCTGTGTVQQLGSPSCTLCEIPGEPDGWRYGRHEDMGRYQTRYGLKPIGPHRRMADEAFRGLTVPCDTCRGRGVRDNPGGWSRCEHCQGLGTYFTVPPDVVDSVREQVLEAFSDAAAPPLLDFPHGVLVHDLARNIIVSAEGEDTRRP